jgi:hypothetical protein
MPAPCDDQCCWPDEDCEVCRLEIEVEEMQKEQMERWAAKEGEFDSPPDPWDDVTRAREVPF